MGHQDDTERYREAAAAALEQIDWCIAYLRRIQKRKLAARLAKNRSLIARRMH